jgi:hypothetical protein
MLTYFLIEIHHNKKNIEVNKIINELIDTSLFLEVEIKLQIFENEKYPVEKILLKFSFISDKLISEKQLNFYSFYLDNYLENKNIDIKSLMTTDIN